MNRSYFICLFLICLLVQAGDVQAAPVKAMLLFDGRTLDNWEYLFDRPDDKEIKFTDVWSISGKGVLRCYGKPESILKTKKNSYKNYVLSLHWRWVVEDKKQAGKTDSDNKADDEKADEKADNADTDEKADKTDTDEKQAHKIDLSNKNAGIIIHATPQGKGSFFPKGLGIDLNPGTAGDFVLLGEKIKVEDMDTRMPHANRISNITDDSENPVGEWNRLDIIVNENTVRVSINGFLVNEGINSTASIGAICLTIDGDPIEFQDIVIRFGINFR